MADDEADPVKPEAQRSITGTNDFDPFTTKNFSSGYSPTTFMTKRGEENQEPVSASVKINKHLHALGLAKIVNGDQFPEIKSVHDLINDALWHRIIYLLREYGGELSESEAEFVETTSSFLTLEQTRLRHREEDRVVNETLAALAEAIESRIPKRIERVIGMTQSVLGSVSVELVPRVQDAIDEAKSMLRTIRIEEDERLRDWGQRTGRMIDPFTTVDLPPTRDEI